MEKINQNNANSEKHEFPIVGIGASAGGLEATIELFTELPSDTGLAYVYVQHLDPNHESNLSSILGRATKMTVVEVIDKIKVEANHLYIIPPNKEIILSDGVIDVQPRPAKPYSNLPINIFFESLAENYKEASVGIILSGSGTDGTIGLKAIKLAGGLTFAQDESAKFLSMPKSAIHEGAVDLVLSPKAIANELIHLSKQKDAYLAAYKELNESFIDNNDEHLKKVLNLLLRFSTVDFSQYKMSTIKRRIIRRMLIHKIESLQEYANFLKGHPVEINHLFEDLLINVTTFFRDPDQFEFLKKHIIPKIIQAKEKNEQIRVWVPACSTGQEAYSLAMLFVEIFGDKYPNLPIQIFATDLSEIAINKARLGIYSAVELANIPAKRLQRFFSKIDGSYRIIKNIRDLCIFATHNIAKDPPFSRLDMISCCNLLIYLNNQLQKKVLGIFHYSMNNNGILVLGKSESVGSSAYLFSQLDKKFKIFSKKKDVTVRASFEINYKPSNSIKPGVTDMKPNSKNQKSDDLELDKTVESLILQKYMPASVVVNGDLDILQFRGSTSNFLEPLPGKASLNLMKMARPGLGFELRNIVHKAKKTQQPVRKKDILITIDGKHHKVTIEAIPIKEDPDQEYYLILFIEESSLTEENKKTDLKDNRVKQLESELTALREDMRAIVESQEAANEELQSANEEIVSSNEELQSINEELETSKEEIESSNEELITINQELQVRNQQLLEANEYALSVFTAMRESLLILDKDYRVKTANSVFFETFQCKEEDTIGAIIFDLNNGQWNISKFRELLDKVLPDNSQYNGYELIHDFKIVGRKRLLINAKRISQKTNRRHLILLAIEDVTEQDKAGS